MPKRLNFKRDILKPLIFALIVLSLYLSWLYSNAYNLLRAQVEIAKIDYYRFKLISLQRIITDAETGQRGYFITNNPTFLDSYKNGQKKVEEIVSSLEKIQINIPEQLFKALELRKLSAEKFRIIDASIQVQLHAGAYASHLTLSKDKGKIVMDKIEAIVADMDAWLQFTKQTFQIKPTLSLQKLS